jgi:hypothetical protein
VYQSEVITPALVKACFIRSLLAEHLTASIILISTIGRLPANLGYTSLTGVDEPNLTTALTLDCGNSLRKGICDGCLVLILIENLDMLFNFN